MTKAVNTKIFTRYMTKNASLLLLLHQPFRITDSTQFSVDSIDTLFQGHFKKPGQESSNKAIFERIAQNSYIPTGQYLLDYIQKNSDFKVNFTFSGTFLEQCLIYPEYGSQVLDIFKKLVQTGNVGVAGENYYHGVSHMYSWSEFGAQINLQRKLIKDLFGVWPTFFRNTENKFNNEIAEFIRLIGFETMGAPGISRYINKEEKLEIKTIERPRFDRDETWAAISNNPNEFTARYLSIAPINHALSDIVFFLKKFKGEASKKHLQDIINDNAVGFHLLFNDFEVLGEHSRDDGIDILEVFTEFITICKNEGVNFVNITDIPEYANFESKKYNIPFDVSSGNAEQNLESWRGNFLQEKAFVSLTYLHDKAKKLIPYNTPYSQKLLESYRKLTTSDHFYYLADIPGENGLVHEMFSPYRNRQDAYTNYEFALKFVSKEIDKFLASVQ